MDPTTTLALMAGALLILFLMGMPIYAAFLLCNLGALYFLMGYTGISLFVNSMASTATSATLLALPLFVLMGEMLYRANAIGALVNSADKLVGRLRGRQFILAVIVSTILATLSGSQMASSAMLSRTVYPAMRERGYDQRMSLGVIMGGACLAPIIPPSVLAIIIATIAQVSVRDLFVAGVVPGLLIAFLMLAYVYARIGLNPEIAPPETDHRRPSRREVAIALFNLLPFTFVIGGVIGSISLGIATPTESAVAGVLGAMVVAAMFGKLNLPTLCEAFRSTARITGMVLAIMLSSQLFSQLLAFSGAGVAINRFMAGLELHPSLMLLLLMAVPFVICMVLDEVAAMLILIPVYLPLLAPLQIDPVLFWTLFLINMTLGGIVPPVGYTLFVMQGVIGDVKLGELYKASIPFVAIFLFAMLLMATFPELVLFML
ncbi:MULTISPECIES: TRAP transporter large permease [Neorhizobium]|uniref:TRAP transporter large permease n=1 Tax=Neorhizobium TaxID=1525371 RepID=UPI00155EB87B|nr:MULTISPECIES: TRAP transporter large permease [Neorhizobium]